MNPCDRKEGEPESTTPEASPDRMRIDWHLNINKGRNQMIVDATVRSLMPVLRVSNHLPGLIK